MTAESLDRDLAAWIGRRVKLQDSDEIDQARTERYGPPVVVAVDDPPGETRPSAWLRWGNEDGGYRYRSCDVCDLEAIPHDR